MIRPKILTTVIFCITSITTFASAMGISPGDVLIHGCLMETGDALYLLRREKNYEPVKLRTRSGWLDYDIDRARGRLYYHDGSYNYSYLKLTGEEPVEERAKFLPKGMGISSCAADGSCLILYKEAPDDIYLEENPIVTDTGRVYGTTLYMLYRYDMRTKKLTRFTYSYAQRYSWVTPDGKCLAYLRYYEGWRSHFDATIIFCRIDGTAKRDLRFAFEDAGIDMVKIGSEFSFAPKVGYEFNGEKYYYAVFRPERTRGDEVEGPGILEYYYAKLKYEGEELECEITPKVIKVPDGVAIGGLCSAPSSENEIYFLGDIKGVGSGIVRYDVYDGTFYVIPNTGVFLSFLVY